MYAQIFFVTSVRGNFFAPQIAASSGLRVFGAKMPLPAFFFSAVIFFKAAFVIVVFVVVVVTLTAVFVVVVVVIAIGERKCAQALSLE